MQQQQSIEEKFNYMVNVADNNLNHLERQKQLNKPSSYQQQQGNDNLHALKSSSSYSESKTNLYRSNNNAAMFSPNQEQLNLNNNPLYHSNNSNNNASSTIKRSNTPNQLQYSSNEYTNNNQQSSHSQQEDKKYDIMLRKQKILEERLKKLETNSNQYQQISQERFNDIQQLQEEQKNDKKTITSLKSQVVTLKSKLDILLSNEDIREKVANSLSSTDLTGLNEIVTQKVSLEINRVMDTIVRKAMKEHSRSQQSQNNQDPSIQQPLDSSSSSSNNNQGNKVLLSRSTSLDHITLLERELIRMNTELERIKTRQQAVESTCNELKQSQSIRELKVEEFHKKAISAHRMELDSFIGMNGKKINEALQILRDNDCMQIRSDLNQFIDKSGSALAEFDMKIHDLEEHKDSLYQESSRMFQTQAKHQAQLGETQSIVEQLLGDSETLSTFCELTNSHSKQFLVFDERLEAMDMNISVLTCNVETNATPVELLAKSIDAINEKFESRTDKLKHQLDENHQHLQNDITDISESLKKTKSKIKDLAETVKAFTQIRVSIESVLKEVDHRAKQDASWTYQFKSSLQKLELRYNVLEENIQKVLDSKESSEEQSAIELQSVRDSIDTLQQELIDMIQNGDESVRDELEMIMKEQYQSIDQQQNTYHRNHQDELDSYKLSLSSNIEQVNQHINNSCIDIKEMIHQVEASQNALQQEVSAKDTTMEILHEKLLEIDTSVSKLEQDKIAHDQQISQCFQTIDDQKQIITYIKDKELVDINNDINNIIKGEIKELQESIQNNEIKLNNIYPILEKEENQRIQSMNELANEVKELEKNTVMNNNNIRSKLYEVVDILANQDVSLKAQIQQNQDTFIQQFNVLQDDVFVIKNEVTSHIQLTNNGFVDIENKLTSYHSDWLDDSSRLDLMFNQNNREQSQKYLEQSQKITDVDEQLTQTLYKERDILDNNIKTLQSEVLKRLSTAEVTIISNDSSSKHKLASVEKRISSQEAAMKERVINLELKLQAHEDIVRTRVSHMEEDLKETIPLEIRQAQDIALEAKVAEMNTMILVQVSSMKERVTEVEDRISTTEGDFETLRANNERLVLEQISELRKECSVEMTELLKSNETNFMNMFEKQEEDLKELCDELQEQLSTQEVSLIKHLEKVTLASNATVNRVNDLEHSIVATDELLTEQVNDLTQQISLLNHSFTSVETTSALDHEAKESVLSRTAEMMEKLSILESEMMKRNADVDHRISLNHSTLKVKCTELDHTITALDEKIIDKVHDLEHIVHEKHNEMMDAIDQKISIVTMNTKELHTNLEQAINHHIDSIHNKISEVHVKLDEQFVPVNQYITEEIDRSNKIKLELQQYTNEMDVELYRKLNDLCSNTKENLSEDMQELKELLTLNQNSIDTEMQHCSESILKQQSQIEFINMATEEISLKIDKLEEDSLSKVIQQIEVHSKQLALLLTQSERDNLEHSIVDQNINQRVLAIEQKVIRQEANTKEVIHDVTMIRELLHNTIHADIQTCQEQLVIHDTKLISNQVILKDWCDRCIVLEHSIADLRVSLSSITSIEEQIITQKQDIESKINDIEGMLQSQLSTLKNQDTTATTVTGKAPTTNSNKDDSDSLSQFNHIIEHVNYDILTLEQRLEAFKNGNHHDNNNSNNNTSNSNNNNVSARNSDQNITGHNNNLVYQNYMGESNDLTSTIEPQHSDESIQLLYRQDEIERSVQAKKQSHRKQLLHNILYDTTTSATTTN